MPTLEPVGLGFLTSAPLRVTQTALVEAEPQRVFAAIAHDPAGWGAWFPGMDSSGHWDTPPPQGVGSERTMRFNGLSVRERVLAWDEGHRWAFCILASPMPLMRAFAEDYSVAADGPARTQLTWTVAMEPTLPSGALRPAFALTTRRLLAVAARRLTRTLRA